MVNAPFTPLEQSGEQPKKSIIKKLFIILGIIVVVLIALGIIASLVVSASLDDARDRAREAAVRQSIRSVIPTLILCGDTEPNTKLYPPRDGGLICAHERLTWPEIRPYYAKWVGCDFNVEYDDEGYIEDFQFCAITEKGIVHLCTINGCIVK